MNTEKEYQRVLDVFKTLVPADQAAIIFKIATQQTQAYKELFDGK